MSFSFITTFFYSQLFVTPPYPTHDFSGQTIIVTGSNTGLGFEAARHFVRLNCAKLIIAVRTTSKGEQAKEDILKSTGRTSDCIEVWPLDLTKSESVKAFATRAKSLDRLDVLLENAGIQFIDYVDNEGFEATIKVNVISTFLLALLMLPKLKESAQKHNTTPHLAIVSSEVMRMADLEAMKGDIYAKLNDKAEWPKVVQQRYPISKLLEVLFVRELAKHVDNPIITLINPGLCWSEFSRNIKGIQARIFQIAKTLLARTTEVGSRTLVAGCCPGQVSHGQFMSDSMNQEVEAWMFTAGGQETQKRVYDQTLVQLEKIDPGVSKNI